MAEPYVLALVPDLLFASRIEQALRHLGYRAEFAPDGATLLARMRADPPALVLVDLAARGVEPVAVIQALKQDPVGCGVPVVAFGPHRDTAARTAAQQAGAVAVVANARLALDLPDLVARYARGARA
ncbi:MAG TPA: response regulator [Chloroflexota bacterium]|nr:response regulator [Chloroflexota bacterium]